MSPLSINSQVEGNPNFACIILANEDAWFTIDGSDIMVSHIFVAVKQRIKRRFRFHEWSCDSHAIIYRCIQGRLCRDVGKGEKVPG